MLQRIDPAVGSITQEDRIAAFMRSASIEMTPKSVRENNDTSDKDVPPGTKIYIPHIGDLKGLQKTIDEIVPRLKEAGFNPVPHIAARRLADEGHLMDITMRMQYMGVTEILPIAGGVPDGQEKRLKSSWDVIALDHLQNYGVRTIGLAGHPDGHANMSMDEHFEFLDKKIDYLRDQGVDPYIVTQMSFQPENVKRYAEKVRELFEVPVSIGMAGPSSLREKMDYAKKCDMGGPLKMIADMGPVKAFQIAVTTRPDHMIDRLAEDFDPTDAAPISPHFFTFDAFTKTLDYMKSLQAGQFRVQKGRVFGSEFVFGA